MIENELKYVLLLDCENLLAAQLPTPAILEQAYLPGNGRIRAVSRDKCWFTYKLPTPDGLFELEKELSYGDFTALLPHAETRLMKRRYQAQDGKVHWDIDFFYTETGETYFAMAEAEMPVWMGAPPRILPLLEDLIVYAVPRDESHLYTSARLTSVETAQSLLKGRRLFE